MVLTAALIEKGVCGLAGKKTNEGAKEILFVSFTVWLGLLGFFWADAHLVPPDHRESRRVSLGLRVTTGRMLELNFLKSIS